MMRKVIEECEGCGFENIECEDYNGIWLCDLCAGTPSGNAVQYPSQYKNRDTLRTICYVGNAIMKKLSEIPQPKKTMTGREYELRHSNPYDLGDHNQPRMKR